MTIRTICFLLTLAFASASSATSQGLQWSHTPAQDVGLDVAGSALATFDDGSGLALYVGGQFTMAGGSPAVRIARWNGVSWSSVGPGFSASSVFADVRALLVHDDGTGPALYAGGTFTHCGTTPLPYLARWDGNAWSPVGDGIDREVFCLATYDDGTGPALYVGCRIDQVVRRWDGVRWTSLPAPQPFLGEVRCLAVHTDAQGTALWVGGTGNVTAFLARWDGTSWSEPLTSVVGSYVTALCSHDDGTGSKLYAGGGFSSIAGTTAWRIARRDAPGVWSALSNGLPSPGLSGDVGDLLSWDDGTGPALFVGGGFLNLTSGVALNRIARWSGGTWSVLGGGITTGFVRALLVADLGRGAGDELYVTGSIFELEGNPANHFARWTPAEPSGGPYCPGDGSGRACPCGNASAAADRSGCLNSLGTGGKLVASGEASVANDTFVLHASQMPATTTVVICQAQEREMFGAGSQFGDGLRCVAGSLVRVSTSMASAGAVTVPSSGQTPLSVRGGLSIAGGTRMYQAVYRSAANYCTSATFNATNAWIVRWVP